MKLEAESKVGSKEELYPLKKIREALGLKPGRKVRFRVEDNKLIVEPIPTLADLVALKPTTRISLKEFHEHRRELSRAVEQASQADH